MAVSTFTDAQASFGFWGWFDSLSNTARRCWQSYNCTWTGYVTGTQLRMACGAGGSLPFWVSVDGGAETNPTLSAGYVTLFTGLSDTAHFVRIRSDAAYTPTNAYTFTSGTVFEVTGAAPAIGQGSDLGPSWVINDTSAPILSSLYLGSLPTANQRPYVKRGSNGTPAGYATGGAVLFNAQCSDIWIHGGYKEVWLSIDGALPTKIDLAAASAVAQWRKIATGLDSAAMHKYLVIPGTTSSPTPAVVQGIMIGGPSAVFGSKPTDKAIWQIGDSITQSMTTQWVSSGAVDVHKYAAAMGRMPYQSGKQGQTTAGLNTDLASIIAALPSVPTDVVLCIGRNDTSGATFRTNYTAVINTLKAAGVLRILCRRIIPDNTLFYKTTLDADIQTVVASFADPNIAYMGSDSWVGITTVEGHSGNDNDGTNPSFNGTHPDRAGYVTMYNLELASIQAFFTEGIPVGEYTYIGGAVVSKQGTVYPVVNGLVLQGGRASAIIIGSTIVGLDGHYRGTLLYM